MELPAFERHRADYLDDDAFRKLQSLLMMNQRLATRFLAPAGCASCDLLMNGAVKANAAVCE